MRRHTLSILVHLVVSRHDAEFFQHSRGFHAHGFYEKWKYLPGRIGKNFLVRQFLPSRANRKAIPAGSDFPRPVKIDV